MSQDTNDLEWDDEEAVTSSRIGLGSARVLVADDDEEMRSAVTTTLVDEGFAVSEAGSASDVFRILQQASDESWPEEGLDLLVLDHRMPGTTGLEVLTLLRSAEWDTPAILMTGFADSRVVEEAARLGVKVLSKPFRAEELTRSAIALLLAKSAASKQPGSSWRLSDGGPRRA